MLNKTIIINIVILIIGISISTSVCSTYWENRYNTLKLQYNEELIKNQKFLIERESKINQIIRLQNERDLALKKSRETKIEYIDREITRYEKIVDNTDCIIDADWVRIYNSSRPGANVPTTPSNSN